MSRPLLPVPHRTEAFAGACLPACCQMALALWGISESQSEIAAQIGHIEGAGTAARNITRLTALGVEVEWREYGMVNELGQAIAGGRTHRHGRLLLRPPYPGLRGRLAALSRLHPGGRRAQAETAQGTEGTVVVVRSGDPETGLSDLAARVGG
jgi:hypothetical protein